jgi:hypothetical protein
MSSGARHLLGGLTAAVVAALLGGGPALGQVEYTITFGNVTVRFPGAIDETPEAAHLEPPTDEGSEGQGDRIDEADTPASRPDVGRERQLRARPGPWRGGYPWDRSGRLADPQPPPPSRQAHPPDEAFGAASGAPLQPLAFAPGQGTANPSFVQHGFLVEPFWVVKTGSPQAYFKRAHFHPADLATGFEAQHLGNRNELHGIYIRSVDGKPFGLVSLRYRVTRNRQLPSKPFSLEGFSNFNVNVLVARTFDPRSSVRAQFLGFPVGIPLGNDLTLPWVTLRVFGFELVSQVYVASSASVDLDDIVLVRHGEEAEPPAPVPELTEPRPAQAEEEQSSATESPGSDSTAPPR